MKRYQMDGNGWIVRLMHVVLMGRIVAGLMRTAICTKLVRLHRKLSVQSKHGVAGFCSKSL